MRLRSFEEHARRQFPTSTAADFAPLEAGIVDEDTYVEQGLKWKDVPLAATSSTSSTTGRSSNTDLLLVGNPVTDEFSHQFMGLISPTDMDGDPNPYFDDLTNDNVPDGRVAIREGYIRSAYQEADETLELGRALMGDATRRRSSRPTTASRRSGTRSTRARCSQTPGSRTPGADLATAGGGRRDAGQPRQGVLGGRHGADLRQLRRCPARLRRTSGPDQVITASRT